MSTIPVPVSSPGTGNTGPDAAGPFIESVMAEWKVPGLAVAVVRDGWAPWLKGFGYRDAEARLPVTPQTLFAIASNTKSFTATLMGMLNDEGRLDWDGPVRESLPDFRLRDSVATEQMTVRDLMSHRSGLPGHDLLWLESGLGRGELCARLRHLQPSKPFRSAWQYQNLMFMTAGLLAERITGIPWETLVRERILRPLGMHRTNFTVTDLQRDADAAQPCVVEGGQLRRVPCRNVDAIGPAGSINSSVEEMARYLRFHLDLGRQDGRQLLSEANARLMQSPQMFQAPGDDLPEPGPTSYGFGLFVTSYRGRRLVFHMGEIDGFTSTMAWFPDDRIGIVVLTNLGGGNPVPDLVVRHLADRLLALDPVDWVARVRQKQAREGALQTEARAKAVGERKSGTAPTHALSEYAGRYGHPAYGDAEVRVRGSGLEVDVVGLRLPLGHFHYDLFEVPEGLPGVLAILARSRVTFLYDKKGEIDRFLIPLEPAVDDIVFTRVPESRAPGK